MRIHFNTTLNKQVRMLDGQWQGVKLASDGRVYFFGGSHSAGVSAPFFRYDPTKNDIELLAGDMTRICGEDPAETPTQGKVHSDILEHQGWLYFGTHLSDYSAKGCETYTGAHLVGFEMATGHFRDYGVIHPNFTNYSAVGLDPAANCVYVYTTPFGFGDGPHLHRIDLATGENRDLGLVTPWKGRDKEGKGHGQPCAHLFVDRRGDVWFSLRDEHALFVARGATGQIERHNDVFPGKASQWYHIRPLDGDRALVALPDGFYIFDSRLFDSGDAFALLKPVATPGFTWAYVAVDDKRFYWNSRSVEKDPKTDHFETRILSSSFSSPQETIDHGSFHDAEGRAPWFLGDLASDGAGRLYSAGRWYVRPEEEQTIGVNRHGLMVAVFFTALDVSDDLRSPGK